MVLMKERVGRLLMYLQDLIYPKTEKIQSYKMIKTTERFADVAHLDTSAWETFTKEELWGGHREFFWFDTIVTIPEEFDGKCVVYELKTGQENNWDATNPQFLIYIDGKTRQGMDLNHREVLITECAKAGETFHITLSAFTGDQNFSLKMDSVIKVLDRKTEKYFYDLAVPFKVAKLLSSEDAKYITIIQCINESLNLLDLRKEYSKEYYDTLASAQNYITKEFYEKECGDSEAIVYCVGHTHIDVAWLWTLAVTEDKAVRSFSTVLEYMRRYPEYIFMSSQPQLYKYVKKNAPEVFAEIQERVQEGRWEVDGGMFVEADCNIASGESLVRQFIYGQRFFEEEFQKDNKILWLPDVFGYSAALPQIMKKCGLPYFMTTKISWNEFNKMPYDTFEWEGIDGTRVLTHFIPARDYNRAAVEGGFETGHFTTYNGYLNPSQTMGSWQRYSQKGVNNEVLMSFGHGDGGGGPTLDMLENQRRLEKGIPGSPKTKMSTARDFFEILEKKVKGNKYLPAWVGELYLEYHRGTYTSMARNKKYNRKSEFGYQNAEFYGLLEERMAGGTYPKQQIRDAWEVILRNQFHDILPGSSIKEVYDDSKAEYEGILETNKKMLSQSLSSITANINAAKNSVVVYNPNSVEGYGVVSFVCPEGISAPAVFDGEDRLAVQKIAPSEWIFVAAEVPSKGYKTFRLADVSEAGEVEFEVDLKISKSGMENEDYIVEINEKGQFSRIYDKYAKREVLKPGCVGNVLMSYEDRPHNYDAWDINNYYTEKSWEIDQVESIEVVEEGPVRSCLKVVRKYLDSTITQYIYLYNELLNIDIKNEIDWKEKLILVRALFPVDIHASEATYEIQYGNVKRPTHYNTSWDFARFEVCAHKWMDLSEDDYGVSILNDCKYGCNVHDGVMGLSLLKSAIHPNPEADKEFHEFTYSLLPHIGGWKDACVVEEAYMLNNPLTAVVKQEDGGNLPGEYSFVTSSQDNVVIEVVKKAEESDSTIVRVYECYNRRTDAALLFADEIASISECNLLEKEDQPMQADGRSVAFQIKPYEIKTFKVTFK